MTYKLIDHTADFGIEVYGPDHQTVFTNAAEAMFDLVLDSGQVTGSESEYIEVSGTDWPDLLVNWLRELLYLFNGERKVIKSVEIKSISENRIAASIFFDYYSPEHHFIKNEIKAVTYHQAEIKKTDDGLIARIIFDV